MLVVFVLFSSVISVDLSWLFVFLFLRVFLLVGRACLKSDKFLLTSVPNYPLDAPPTHPETTSTASESVWASLLNNRGGLRPRKETPGREGGRVNKRPESEQTNSKDIR